MRNLGLRLRVALVRLKLRLLLLLHRHELFVLVPVRRFRFGPQLLLAKVLLFRQTLFRICVQRSMQPEWGRFAAGLIVLVIRFINRLLLHVVVAHWRNLLIRIFWFHISVVLPVAGNLKLLRLSNRLLLLLLSRSVVFLHLLFIRTALLNLVTFHFWSGPAWLLLVTPHRGNFVISLQVVSAYHTHNRGYRLLRLLPRRLAIGFLNLNFLLGHHPQVFLIFLNFWLLDYHLLKLNLHHLQRCYIPLRSFWHWIWFNFIVTILIGFFFIYRLVRVRLSLVIPPKGSISRVGVLLNHLRRWVFWGVDDRHSVEHWGILFVRPVVVPPVFDFNPLVYFLEHRFLLIMGIFLDPREHIRCFDLRSGIPPSLNLLLV